MLFCLSEFIEESSNRKDMKIGMDISNDEFAIKFEDISEIYNSLKKWKTIFHTFSVQYIWLTI